ncbi:MAG TPA: hypothetical protein GXX75_15650 [Clostridiales bacterium]|nr:hypothetical protein [Clostridiales bacterium]
MSLIDNEHQLPVGLGMKLALDMSAMTNFVRLSDDKKKQLVGYIEGSTTGDEARNRVNEVVSNLHKGDTYR